MRILIDAHMVGERETGNETYVVELIRALQALDSGDELLVAAAHRDEVARRIEPGPRTRILPVSASGIRRLLIDLPRLARRERADVLHVTYTGPPNAPCPLVVTVHDVVYRRHPRWFSPRDLLVLELGVGSTLRRAAAVLTVSEHARRDIATRYACPSERITVTHGAADLERFRPLSGPREADATLTRLGIERPYVLAVGNLQPRKNLRRLVEAFARLAPTHRLVLVGRARWRGSEIAETVRRLGLERRVIFTGYVDDADLPRLYGAADLVAFPTLFEGFGLPVLEAMACGTPVVSSRVASIPEVAGDAALLVDPRSVGEIAGAIERVLVDRELAARLAAAGVTRAHAFSWQDAARRTREVYRRAASLTPSGRSPAPAPR